MAKSDGNEGGIAPIFNAMSNCRAFLPLIVRRIGLHVICVWMFVSCGDEAKPSTRRDSIISETVVVKNDSTLLVKSDSTIEQISPLEIQLRSLGLVDVNELDSEIVVDLKYSTTDNFIGVDVYGDFNKCFLQPDVATKLVKAEKALKQKFPFYTLVIYDAVRPLHIQQKMWDTLVLPPGEKIKYLSNPGNGSLHNYGAAVDLSIVDQYGIPLDMGTPFDYFGVKAHPEREQELLVSGELSQRQISNREILRDVMRKAGFFGIQTEWWHFNSCTRAVAATAYKIVE